MLVAVDFNHGPVSLRDGFFLGASEFLAYPANTPTAATARTVTYPFEFHGQTTFGGALNFVAELPPLERVIEAGRFSFSGGRVTGTLDERHLTANAEADTFQFDSGSASLALQGISASADNEILSRYVTPGVFELEAARAFVDTGFENGAQEVSGLEMAGLALRGEIGLDAAAELLDGAVNLAIESARNGADMHVTNARFEMAASRVDLAALEAFVESSQRPDVGPQPRFEELEPAVERLLAAGPGLSIDPLRFDVDGAPFELTVFAASDSSALPSTGPLDLGDLEFWFAFLSGTATLEAAKPLVERFTAAIVKSQLGSDFVPGSAVPFEALDTMASAQAGFVLAMLAAQGMIEDTGHLYRTEVRLENGSLTLNGNPLPFGVP